MPELTQGDLDYYIGGGELTRWNPVVFSHFIATPGVMHIAENGGEHGAYWLLDAIASHVKSSPRVIEARKSERFDTLHFWKLEVDLEQKTAVLSCFADSDQAPIVTQNFSYTDFPLSSVDIWVTHDDPEGPWLLVLPQER